MSTPLADALRDYMERGAARMHMPGHKGFLPYPLGQAASWDVTEVEGTDSLYQPAGPIAAMESAYAELYGAGATLLSAGGSTLCIQAMLAAMVPPGGTVLALRGVHASAVHAMALLDITPRWLYPSLDPLSGLALPVTPLRVRRALEEVPADAVYLTSPDYYGCLADIEAIAPVCREHGAKLLVDAAHGSHLPFLSPKHHPMNGGADACCNSLHKTLPALTGAALLHLRDAGDRDRAKAMMAVFGSSSPSYLVMLSADQCLGALQGEGPARLQGVAARVSALEELATERGSSLLDAPRDPLRLTMGFAPLGYTRTVFRAALREAGIEPEYLGASHCVFLPGISTPSEHWNRLREFLYALPSLEPINSAPVSLEPVPRALSLRQALLSPWEELGVLRCAGRTAAVTAAPCPPGIPLVIPGEQVTENAANTLNALGISRLRVVK